MSKLTLLWILLFVLALGVWRYFTPESKVAQGVPEKFDSPDSTAAMVVTTKYEVNGTIGKRIYAASAHYFSTQNKTDFTHPKIIVFDPKGVPEWSIQSLTGTLYGQERAIMQGEVEAQSLQANSFIERFNTSRAEMNIVKRLITSEEPVIIRGQKFISQGVGLRGDLNRKTINILDKSHATYSP